MRNLIQTDETGRRVVTLDPNKRVLFLTRDLDLIRRQLAGELDLRMEDVDPGDLLDDINTDVMTPGVGLLPAPPGGHRDRRLRRPGRRGRHPRVREPRTVQRRLPGDRVGTAQGDRVVARDRAAGAERWSGIELVIAASFAPIHARNNINLGQLMGSYDDLERLQRGEAIPLDELTGRFDPVNQAILENGGLFPFSARYKAGRDHPARARHRATADDDGGEDLRRPSRRR